MIKMCIFLYEHTGAHCYYTIKKLRTRGNQRHFTGYFIEVTDSSFTTLIWQVCFVFVGSYPGEMETLRHCGSITNELN